MQNCKAELSEYLSKHIGICLDELNVEKGKETKTDFIYGEIYAYVECLEIILIYNGADNETLRNLELKYGVI